MSAYTRVDLAQLPDYVPGRSIPGAIKLASNEVSAGPLPSVVAAISAAASGVNRYPDSGAGAAPEDHSQGPRGSEKRLVGDTAEGAGCVAAGGHGGQVCAGGPD